MRQVIGYVAVILVALWGIFYLLQVHIFKSGDRDTIVTTVTDSEMERMGTVSAINQDQVVFDGPFIITIVTENEETYEVSIPSMGLPLCAGVASIASPSAVAIGDLVKVRGVKNEDGAIAPCSQSSHFLEVFERVSDPVSGLSFAFQKGPNGYVMNAADPRMSVDPNFITGYILTLASDLEELQNSTEPRDGAPTIQVRTYRNPEGGSPADWAMAHPLESNIELAFGEPVSSQLQNVPAVTYTADGLYASKVTVAENGGFIYLFTVAYIDDNSPQLSDMEALMETVNFEVR